MGKQQRSRNAAEWWSAKKLCRLSSRQIEMARALGMNPKKLPGLRPSPQQRWNLPVGAFIEDCYRKRFSGAAATDKSRQPKGESRLTADNWLEPAHGLKSQVENLVCYFANLSEDLERWLTHGTVAPEVLVQVRKELRAITNALEAGEAVPQMPEIPIPPAPKSERSAHRVRQVHTFDGDDEIPF
jgi:hypothetical protein